MKQYEAELIVFITHNIEYIRKTLLAPLKTKRQKFIDEDSLHIDEIEKQFKDRAKWVLATDICLRMKVPIDEVIIFLETVNFDELLK